MQRKFIRKLNRMKDNILDTRYQDSNDLKEALTKGGFKHFFELKNGNIMVKESDVVQVNIELVNGTPIVKTKFPNIGNVPQILFTVLLLALSISVGLPFSWIIAIGGGQLFSYAWFMPKIKQLKNNVETVL